MLNRGGVDWGAFGTQQGDEGVLGGGVLEVGAMKQILRRGKECDCNAFYNARK